MQASYLYTETAFHHEGSFDFLKKLIDASKACGVNGIKFQILIEPSEFISSKHSSYEQIAGYCLKLDDWEAILEYTGKVGLDIIVMPLDLKAVEFCLKFPVRYMEIHSVSFYDDSLLEKIKDTNIPLIIGAGGRTTEELIGMHEFFKKQLQVLMMGFQSFPSKIEDIKLSRISHLKEIFPSLEIGYADHSSFDDPMAITSNEYARLLGASFFEKHITIEEGKKRTDYNSAVCPETIIQIKNRIEFIDKYILVDKNTSSQIDEAELIYRNRQKKVVPNRNMKAGEIIKLDDLSLKMIDKEDGFASKADLVNKRMKMAVDADDLINHNHIDI